MPTPKNLAENPLLSAALCYAERGWPIFPLQGKIPLKGSHGFQDATQDPERVKTLWNGTPYNIGLATGDCSGIFVLDIDPDTGGSDSLAAHEATYGLLPETPHVITGNGGIHYYFRMPRFNLSISAGKLGIGIDTRGNGGYVVLPPSIHPDTKRRYEWEILHDIDEIPLADVPHWIITLLQSSDKLPPVSDETRIPEGARDATLFRHGCRLRTFGYSYSEILVFLTEMNACRCMPPMSEKDIRKIADQSAKYQPGQAFRVYDEQKPMVTMTGKDADLPKPETLTELLQANLPDPHQIVSDFLHEGLLLFGGKSKRGKSWLMMDIALSVSLGRHVLQHYSVPQATPILYLALEDGRKRIQGRAKKIQENLMRADNYHLLYDFPKLGEGGIELLEKYIKAYGFQLVVIDVLAKLESSSKKSDNGEKGYHQVYDMFTPLQELRNNHPFALAMLTHLRKQDAEDVFDNLHGSVAYQGAQDVLWVLERKPKDDLAFLHMRDKDAEDRTIALKFVEGHWEYLGEGEEYEVSKDQRVVMRVLRDEAREMPIQEIMKSCEFPEGKYGYVRKLLSMMTKDDLIHRTKQGKYSATIRAAQEMLADDDDEPF